MREEFLKETASKEEQYRKTLYEYEEKLYEVQERSTNSSENTETPRVKYYDKQYLSSNYITLYIIDVNRSSVLFIRVRKFY